MRTCRACDGPTEVLLDSGSQPLCNRYPNASDEREETYPLVLGTCQRCGLVQLLRHPPADALIPRVDWITYREPGDHIDDLARHIMARLGKGGNGLILGVSFKDDTLLGRLAAQGHHKARRIDPQADLGSDTPGVGVETVQDRLTAERARALSEAYGQADVVVARHILEHAFDPVRFGQALQELCSPGGLLVIEVPDCAQALATLDYSTIWEEHILYFTEETFRSLLSYAGLDVVSFLRVPYTLEDSLIAVARRGPKASAQPPASPVLEEELNRARRFGRELANRRRALQEQLDSDRQKRGRVALLGAGHLATAFVNLLELGPHLDFVADDDANKQGRFLPGSRLPILPSEALLKEGISLCLTTINPGVEEQVLAKHRAFLARGGKIASIFPRSPRAYQPRNDVGH